MCSICGMSALGTVANAVSYGWRGADEEDEAEQGYGQVMEE